MAAKITPHLIHLSYEAALKSFWRKSALRQFLRECHISESFLATWSSEESKREFLDRAFENLQKSDRGKAVIYQMAVFLADQTTFPDLRHWEDSAQKISDATKAVAELKAYLNKQDEEIRSEREREERRKHAREETQRIQRARTDKVQLQARLDSLYSVVGTQNGGYAFQDWFYDLLDFCEIDNRRPYVSSRAYRKYVTTYFGLLRRRNRRGCMSLPPPSGLSTCKGLTIRSTSGRQIDGSLTHEGTTYLVELKFTGNQAVATDIDSIKAKVNDKADNTMGIMVSISGYSSVAIDEASGKKTPLLLLDASHLYLFLTGIMHFSEIITRVRRHASQTGEAHLAVSRFGG